MIYSDTIAEELFSPPRRWNRLTITLEGETDIQDVISFCGEEQQSVIQSLNIPQTIFGSGTYQFRLNPKITIAEWIESDCLQIICSNPQAIIALEVEYICEAVEQEKQARIAGDEQLAASLAQLQATKEDVKNKVISWENPDNTQYPSAKLVKDSIDAEANARLAGDQGLQNQVNTINTVLATKENVNNKVVAWNNPTHTQYPSAKLVYDTIQNSGAGPHKLDGSGHLEPDDTTTFNATTERHGLMPKLSGNSGHVMCGDGQWRNYANYWDTLQFTPPQLSQFSWVNQRNVYVREDNSALTMIAPASGITGDKNSVLVKPIQSQVFDFCMGFTCLLINVSYQLIVLALYDYSSGKMITLHMRNDLRVEVVRWNNPSSWSSTASTVYINHLGSFIFFRIQQTSTNRYFYISYNGVDWISVGQTSNTDWIVPTHIGFGINPYNSSYAQCATFVHWIVKY